MDYAISKQYSAKHPSLSRDTGAGILALIQNASDPVPVNVYKEFAADSLFCEYAYVVDFDKGTFEVFKGFNRTPLAEGERFAFLSDKAENGYTPVLHVKTYQLDALPTDEAFLAELEHQDEEE
ncbi:TPA: hypothetical protein ACGPBT_002852 [Klebsiella variicola]